MKKILISIIFILIILITPVCDTNPVPSEYRGIRICDKITLADFHIVDNWIFYTAVDESFDSMFGGKILYKMNTHDMFPVIITRTQFQIF